MRASTKPVPMARLRGMTGGCGGCGEAQCEIQPVSGRAGGPGATHGASLTDLSVEIEYEDHPPELRITQGVSALFPSLSSMSFNCVNVAELDLKMPELQSLRLENARGVQRFRLDCPKLERMTFEFVEIQNARDFGPSVGRSPKLEALHAYKVLLKTYRWRPHITMVTDNLLSPTICIHYKCTSTQH